jgi:hypothetical protein
LTATGSWKSAAAVAGRLTAFNPLPWCLALRSASSGSPVVKISTPASARSLSRPDGQAESERERDGWPVVGVAGSDPLLRLIAVRLVVGFQDPPTGIACSAASSSAGPSMHRC